MCQSVTPWSLQSGLVLFVLLELPTGFAETGFELQGSGRGVVLRGPGEPEPAGKSSQEPISKVFGILQASCSSSRGLKSVSHGQAIYTTEMSTR